MLLSAPSRRRTRLGAIPLLFLTVLGLLVGGLGAPAYAAEGTITGTLTRQGSLGVPIQGATVQLIDATTNAAVAGRTAQTDANGAYSLGTPDSAVEYKLQFTAPSFVGEFYNDKASASLADKVLGTSTGINAGLTPTNDTTSQVGGQITTSGGAPIQGAQIRMYERSAANATTGEVSYTPALGQPTTPAATTDINGNWVAEFGFKSWLIEVRAPAFGTFYLSSTGDRSTDPKTAPLVTVKKGEAQRINASLPSAATTTITGRVVTGLASSPVQGVTISVEYPSTNASGQTVWNEVQSTRAVTAADGTYTANVPPTTADRTYVVGFLAPGFRTEYHNDKTTRETADRVSTTFSSPASGINATLSPATQVTGKVTGVNGNALAGVTVRAISYTAGSPATTRGSWGPLNGTSPTTTDADGTFRLDVPADTPFRLEYATSGRETRFYPSATIADEGENITVANNQVVTGRDATLPTLAQLGGSVTEPNGTAYTAGGAVELWRRVAYTEQGERGGPSHSTWIQVPNTQTQTLSNTGGFSFTIPSGSYRLKGLLTGGNDGFLPGLVGLDQAPAISIAAEQVLSLQKYALPAVSQVRGTVTNLNSAPQSGKSVSAFTRYVSNVVDGAPVMTNFSAIGGTGTASTSSDGSYTLNLRNRTYRVGVANEGFYTTGSSVVTAVNDASDLVVTADAAGIDFKLNSGTAQNLQPPFVSGLAQDTERLTANPGLWSTNDATFTYTWQYSSTPAVESSWRNVTDGVEGEVSGGSGQLLDIPLRCSLPMFPPTCVDGAPWAYRVRVTATRAGGPASPAVTSKATSIAKSLTTATTTENRQVPQISGRPAVGETLTATDGQWSEGGTFTYQWLAGGTNIGGATTKSLVLTKAMLGQTITFKVTETSNNPDVEALSAPTAAVAKGVLVATAPPTISGDPFVGATLTANPGTWNDPAPTFTYQWLSNGQVIAGATADKYVPTGADLGRVIQVRVTASQPDAYTNGSATSASTDPVADDPSKISNKTLPVVSGTPKVGETLSTTNGTWTNDPTSFAYQWLADGTAVAGATQSTFVPTAAQAGKKMTVRVTASKTGLTSGTATSEPTGTVTADPTACTITVTGGPTVSGDAEVGSLLTASPGTTTPAGVTASYQWLRDAQAIVGATASTYRVATADEGSALAVQVTYAKEGCENVVRTAQAGTVPETQEPVKPALSTVKKIKGSKLVLKVNVTATTQDPVEGDVELTEKGKTLVSKALIDGKRKLVVKGLKKGFHSVTVTFLGNDLVKERSKTITFTIR